MSDAVYSIAGGGSNALVEIECHTSNSLPNIVIVGSANKAVDEAKERIRGAFANSSLQLPRKRITINLAPADVPKTDGSFDLAIAIAILLAGGQVPKNNYDKTIVLGELGLDGGIRPVRGVIGRILAARKRGFHTFIVPSDNCTQAQLVPNIHIEAIATLSEFYRMATGVQLRSSIETKDGILDDTLQTGTINLSGIDDIVGQDLAKRALEVAAAGGHNLLLSGPPGTGKSMLAKTLPGLLPGMTLEEMLEVTHIHSLAANSTALVARRPFRAPHHSASPAAVLGGGASLRPGEISLSHHGVLFLDEMPEFDKAVLEALRQPLEDRTITIARAKDSITYPAQFMLVATANPCPCGYFGSTKACSCSPSQINRYQQRLSGPILDRIDISAPIQEVDHASLLGSKHITGATTAEIRERIVRARRTQATRYSTTTRTNSCMTNEDIRLHAKLSTNAKTLLDIAASKLQLSARAYMKVVKVARTVADLSDSRGIEPSHITEALQYRPRNIQAL